MAEKRFTLDNEENGLCRCILMNGEEIPTCEIVELLNTFNDENEQLKKEKEDWKSNCLSTINENSILWNEIAIMREQGAKSSSAFEEYCSKFKGDIE